MINAVNIAAESLRSLSAGMFASMYAIGKLVL